MDQKEVIIRLIRDHLVNTRLISGLDSLGLCPDDYYLHLSDTIFKMMEIKDENEELYHAYLDWCVKISKKNIFRDQKLLKKYATEIYGFLEKERASDGN